MDQWRQFAELANREGWFWETDQEHRFVWLSDSFDQITGMEAAWQIGKSRPQLIAGTITQDELDAHLQALANREPFDDFVFKRAGPLGAKWFSASAVPVHDNEGIFTGYRGIGRDVTDQHERQERTLRLEDVMEEIDDTIAVWGEDDHLIYSNKAFRNANSTFADLIDQGANFRQILRKGIELGTFPDAEDDPDGWFEERLKHHQNPGLPVDIKRYDGTVREIRKQRVASGATLHIGVDVTEQRKLVENLRDANERFTDFADVSKDWLWEQDADLRFTYMSHGNDSESEFNRSTYLGKTRQEISLAGVTEAQWAEHDEILARREPLVDFHVERHDADGQRRIISTSGRPFHDADGTFAGYRGTGRDVTDWIGLIEKLERNDVWLRQVLEFASIGVVMVSKDGKYEYANEIWLDMYGCTARELLDIEPASTYADPAERAEIVEIVKRQGQVRDREIMMRTKSGGLFPISLSLQLAPGGAGGLIGWVSDISERKAAEKNLINSQKRFRDFAETSSDWFWEQDADLRFIYISEKESSSGADPYSVIGKTRRESNPRGVTEEQWNEHDAVLARREPLVNFRTERTRPGREKEIIYIDGRPFYDEDGNFAGYRGTGRDVTEQASLIDALEQNEAHLRQMLDAAPIGVTVISPDGKFEYTNERHQEFLGATLDELVGTTPERFYANPRDRDEIIELVERDGEARNLEIMAKRNNGDVFPVQMSLQPTPNGDGRTIGWVIDMSGPKEIEQSLITSQDRFRDFAESSSDWFWE
jgi:PAS domain S-box-containing protein